MTPSDPSDRQSVSPPTNSKGVHFDALDNIVNHPDGTLDSDLESTKAIIDEDKRRVDVMLADKAARKGRRRLLRFTILAIFIVIGTSLAAYRHFVVSKQAPGQASRLDASQQYANTAIPLAQIDSSKGLSVQNGQTLSI